MRDKNKYGLSRYIPNKVKHEIRKRSKYGCVICRCGIYQYEHINPEWIDAKEHNPENICCLCGKCHDKVTRGFLSKDAIIDAYKKVESSDEIEPPSEFFDFHTGEAKLLIGGMIADPIPNIILECYGKNIISIYPSNNSEPATVSAIFTDDDGKECFKIKNNEWYGRNDLFDLETTGGCFTIKNKNSQTILKLRHNPPGEIVVEHLDMRFEDIHILATDNDIAIGRYNGYDNNLIWLHVKIRIDSTFNGAKAIVISQIKAEGRLTVNNPGLIVNLSGEPGRAMFTDQRLAHFYKTTNCGIYWPMMGFQIGKGCEIALSGVLVGVSSIEHARKYFFSPNRMNVFQFYLPAKITEESMLTALAIASTSNNKKIGNNTYVKEPFLVLKDSEGIKKWESRNQHANPSTSLTPFKDDKPGVTAAWSVAIKLIDTYEGSAFTIGRD